MSYYFPFGGLGGTSIQNISYSLSAITASVPTSTTITALTASYATSVVTAPTAGQNGTNISQATCEANAVSNPNLLVSGSTGLQGPTGSKGPNNTSCPENTIPCTALNVSLSAAYNDGVTRGANYYVPSGSQYSIVCMQIPPGCTSVTAVCPPYLPVGNWPSIQ